MHTLAHHAYNDRSTDCTRDAQHAKVPTAFLLHPHVPTHVDMSNVRITRLPAGYAKGVRRGMGGKAQGAQTTGAICDTPHHDAVRQWAYETVPERVAFTSRCTTRR